MKPKQIHRSNAYSHTRNSALLVRWVQDPYAPVGIGILDVSVPRIGEAYHFIDVPKTIYMDLMKRPDPEPLFNNLLRMYLPADEPDYREEW
jgi:hypothetical protein